MSNLETRLEGSRRGRIVQEFFTNSAHFPLANVFLELLLSGPRNYLTEPDPYVLLLGAAIQAIFIGTWQHLGHPRPLLGNLIGPGLYTLIEAFSEGSSFFSSPQHVAYWAFAGGIGLSQQLQLHSGARLREGLILLENVMRTSIVLAMYIILEVLKDGYTSAAEFFTDPPHAFLAVVIPLVGLKMGFAQITAGRYLTVLKDTAGQLRRYSEWLLGPELLSRAVANPQALTLRRHDRAVLFMDIRGFTAWSESRSPEEVVELINAFYEAAEPIWIHRRALKVKLTADEIMLVFETPEAAVDAARELLKVVEPVLAATGLTAGIGIHSGPVVEGLMGAQQRRGYDLLGDTVNTAKRLCDAAAGGQILLSASARQALPGDRRHTPSLTLQVKGKRQALEAFAIGDDADLATLS